MKHIRCHIMVCTGTGCASSASPEILAAFEKEIKRCKLQDEVQIIKAGCLGLCSEGPNVMVFPEGACYSRVTPEDVPEIVEEHILKGRIVTRLLQKDEGDAETVTSLSDTQIYKHQFRIALRNCGVINPEKIDEYIARDGYAALAKALTEMTPDDIIAEVKKAGIRGRGGAGFPTWMKWNFTKQAPGDEKYIVCNADEGDPGAFMDRSILEGDPHSILEAMAIAGRAVGASHGVIYIRAEYPLAIAHLETALKQAREYGLLGKDILGTGFDFDIELRLGAGAFVCGEETALLASTMGKRGMPIPRPPFPAVSGLWAKPTVINNVETWANIPVIILKGGEWFSKIGTEKSTGTKVFALTGKINNSGLIEVPMGITLREIIYDIGGGIRGGKKFKAVQIGGPSGGVITADYLDVPIDYEHLQALGSIMGSGGMIVMDEDDCMVDVARFYQEFCVDESCGKCTPCRIGTRTLLTLLEKIANGKGELDDLKKIEHVGRAMQKAALCGLGQTAPNPVLSTLRYFKDEYLEHINDKKCRAGKCKNLVAYAIDPAKCKGCTACARKCPVGAITGEVKKPHAIDPAKCIKCGVCMSTCKFGAVLRK